MEAMFQVADNLSNSAFYIAADDWTRKAGKEWGIGKRFVAFHNAVEFVTGFLEISPTPGHPLLLRDNQEGSTL